MCSLELGKIQCLFLFQTVVNSTDAPKNGTDALVSLPQELPSSSNRLGRHRYQKEADARKENSREREVPLTTGCMPRGQCL